MTMMNPALSLNAPAPTVLSSTPISTSATATLGMPQPSHQAGSSGALGGLHFNLSKRMLLFGAAGAMLGCVLPVIPGGPVGGAIAGVLLSGLL